MIGPGTESNGHGNLIAVRMRELGTARGTGMLPCPGPDGGAVFFRDGLVIRLTSRRTPGLADGGPPAAFTAGSPLARLAATVRSAEPALDAALELLTGDAWYDRFQPGEVPRVALPCGIGVEDLLTEVARRRRLLSRLAPALTPDTTVTRSPALPAPKLRVSAGQWALLIRVRDGATPRALAWELNQSVFSTTLEVYQLLRLRLLSAPGGPGDGRDLSFILAMPEASPAGSGSAA